MYAMWCNQEDVPLNGTPIRGWGMITQAQQETLIRYSIVTVEDLADLNGEGVKNVGMGAVDLKNKAAAWLKSQTDHGKVTLEIAALKARNSELEAQTKGLQEKLDAATRQIDVLKEGK